MFDKLRRRWPRVYEALEWFLLGLSATAFFLALAAYLIVRGG